MPDYADIFTNHAAKYDLLVSREDYQNNLFTTINSLYLLQKSYDAADLGAGTGRVSFVLAPHVRHIYGIEVSKGMIGQARTRQARQGVDNIEFREGSHLSIPLPDHCVDLVVEGWSFGYLAVQSKEEWRPNIERVFAEVERIVRSNGIIIVIETLGTMREQPQPPANLRPFYDHLEQRLGFAKKQIRTDYRFQSIEETVDLISFFFGEEMGRETKARNSVIVPECTGVWYKYT
jgi:ubiquinone/menaquinone biosynthesis C-methylase UbiE